MPDNISLQEQANKRASEISQSNRVSAFSDYLLKFEGFDEVARRGAGEKYFTIGHGHYGPDVKEGQRISRKDAGLLLKKDINKRIPRIQKLMPEFNSFPASAQTAIFDQASKEFLRNNEYRNRVKLNRAGIGERMERVSGELMKMSK